MTTLYLQYEADQSGGYPLSDDEWCEYAPVYRTFKPVYLRLSQKGHTSWRNENIHIDDKVGFGDKIYIVVVRFEEEILLVVVMATGLFGVPIRTLNWRRDCAS